MIKGSPIHLIIGKYAGKLGWINLENDNSSDKVAGVIVDPG